MYQFLDISKKVAIKNMEYNDTNSTYIFYTSFEYTSRVTLCMSGLYHHNFFTLVLLGRRVGVARALPRTQAIQRLLIFGLELVDLGFELLHPPMVGFCCDCVSLSVSLRCLRKFAVSRLELLDLHVKSILLLLRLFKIVSQLIHTRCHGVSSLTLSVTPIGHSVSSLTLMTFQRSHVQLLAQQLLICDFQSVDLTLANL